jgi:hypothetical protein
LFSPGTPASSTTKTGRHDIHVAEILLKVALKHQKSNQSQTTGPIETKLGRNGVCPDWVVFISLPVLYFLFIYENSKWLEGPFMIGLNLKKKSSLKPHVR